MTDFPDLKLKTLVNFPARASGGTGIEVTKTDGAYTVDLDYSDFAPPTESVIDPTNQTALIWNSVTEAYTLIPISELVDSATAAEYIANSAPTKMLTPGAVWGAAQPIVMADGATITPDLSLGFDQAVALGAAGRTFANPVNGKNGQRGVFLISPGASGTITTWGNSYKFPGGVTPTLTANGLDTISYLFWDPDLILCTHLADFQ